MTNSPIPGDVVARLRGLADEMFSSNLTRDHHPVLPHRFHMNEAADLIEALQRELAARDDTISLLESNARVQATLLADTGRALEVAVEALTEIASLTQTEGLLWWQIRARAAIRDIKGAGDA